MPVLMQVPLSSPTCMCLRSTYCACIHSNAENLHRFDVPVKKSRHSTVGNAVAELHEEDQEVEQEQEGGVTLSEAIVV